MKETLKYYLELTILLILHSFLILQLSQVRLEFDDIESNIVYFLPRQFEVVLKRRYSSKNRLAVSKVGKKARFSFTI